MFASSVIRRNTLKLLRSNLHLRGCCHSYSSENKKLCFAPSRPRELGKNALLSTVNTVREKGTHSSTSAPEEESFEQLLENSKFVRSGNPVGRMAEGEILAVSGEKVYVDFGSKFHAVVDMPEKKRELYVPGARVIVTIKDLETTGHFLGAKKHISLLEAEAELVGLANSNR